MIKMNSKDNDLIFEAYMDSKTPNFKVGDTVIPTAGIWLGHNGIRIKSLYSDVSEALIENHNGFVKKIALADLKHAPNYIFSTNQNLEDDVKQHNILGMIEKMGEV